MNRALLASLGLALAAMACGSNKTFPSLCANQVPPPAACTTVCNNAPGAANSCPAGYFCSADGKCDAQCTLAGGQCGDGYTCTADGRCVMGNGGCTGLECNVADCASMGKQPTTITGTVFAPNGTLPLFGINVYVPNSDPGPLKPGVQCGACSDGLPGNPIVQAVTDEAGKFTLQSIPDGDNIPLVITTGKWRRQIKIPKVAACATQTIPVADTTLPKSQDDKTANTTSLDMPQIAISTGSADSLECLVRRLGIADKEITTDKEAGKIHLYSDLDAGGGTGTTVFDASFAGGSRAFSNSKTLWGTTGTDPGKLGSYDIVILSCEGAQHVETKSQDAMNRLKAYADIGGRVFLSHWHNIWIEGSTSGNGANGSKPAVWPALATWSNNGGNGPTVDTIDEQHNPKGPSFATWMQNVNVTIPPIPPIPRDSIPINDMTGRDTAISVDNNNVERWVFWQKDATTQLAQNFQFSTPNEKPLENRCGKVVFSDMHVSGGPAASNPMDNKTIFPYPKSCGTATDLSPQEKALAFMFFDISSCVGAIF
ncbi:MAG TPA: hypothetical protein VHT91_19365 [Kofleriaceae bacterium]|jgi:hypothetical protein|nr:hypothetical protein [Kofleriaceae bacterium]